MSRGPNNQEGTMKFSRRAGIAGATILLATAVAPAAMADTVTSTVSGGNLMATTAGFALAGVTLNGSNQTVAGVGDRPDSAGRARGTGAGWTVAVTATALTSAAGSVETTARTLPATSLSITDGTVTAGTGSDAASTVTAVTGVALATTSTTVVSAAAGGGKGTFTLTPTITLSIPANSYRSNYSVAVGSSALNPFSGTLTYTIG
jgi:hypothetical protein